MAQIDRKRRPVSFLFSARLSSIFRLSEFRDNKNRHDYIDYIWRGLQIEDPSKDAARALLNDPPLVVRIRPNVTFCLQSYHWFSQPNKLLADFIGPPAHPCSAINYSMSLTHYTRHDWFDGREGCARHILRFPFFFSFLRSRCCYSRYLFLFLSKKILIFPLVPCFVFFHSFLFHYLSFHFYFANILYYFYFIFISSYLHI